MLLTPEAVRNSSVVASGMDLRLELKDYIELSGERFKRHGFARPGSFYEDLIFENPARFMQQLLEAPTLSERWRMVCSITKRYIDHSEGTSFRWGPFLHVAKWSEPLLEAIYATGLSAGKIKQLVDSSFGPTGMTTATVWRHGIGQAYGREYQDRVMLLHQENGEKKLQATGEWVRQVPPIAWAVNIKGYINQVTVNHLQEVSDKSGQNQRQGTLHFRLP